MNSFEQLLDRSELLPLRLREIYEKYAYTRYTVSKFEPYDIYSENRSFLGGGAILTFTDPAGRLMALKPDITLGIIKNTANDARARKLYYCENVFRADRATGEFAEIKQMGLEFIGGDGSYDECEVVHLALESLDAVGGESVLAVSHMGYIIPLSEYYGISDKTGLLKAIKQKSRSGILAEAEKAGLTDSDANELCDCCVMFGNFAETTEILKKRARNAAMREAADELISLADALGAVSTTEKMALDLSVINDFDYYNGLVFRGYIRSVPQSVLSGGRYDAMMRRLGKPQPAIGFALYLGELERYLHRKREFDADVLLVYGNSTAREISEKASKLTASGRSVYAVREDTGDVRAAEKIVLNTDGGNKNA